MGDTNNMFRIGTGWIYNAKDSIGYKVIRNKKGIVVEFKESFRLVRYEQNCYFTLYSSESVPAGVVRKASEISELMSEGKLKVRQKLAYA